ncbi:MAG TPA: DUF58 domain-containing protein [Thermoleophilia bacterium]|nr:DUF58 domain-containing protein [Thermoleophilia bacterium]
MAGATYLAARLLGTWELYLLAFAFLAAVLVSWLLVLATGRRLSVTRTLDPSQPTAGERLTVWFSLRNESQLPGLQVTLPDATGDLGTSPAHVEFPSLGSLQERAVASAPLSAPRGIHHLPPLWARAEDPLGLIRLRRRVAEPLDITVYPRLVDLTSCALFADLGTHRGLGPRGIARLGATEFRGIRAHQPGEPLNHIDWKATAKTGNLMLREMDDPESGDVAVVLDGTSAGVAGEEPLTSFELAVQAAGSVADYVLAAGRSVNLALHDGRWQQTNLAADINGRRRLLDALATVRPNARAPLSATLLKLRDGSGRLAPARTIVLVALSLDRDLVRAVLALHRQGLRVSLIHVVAGSFAAPASGPRRAASPPPGHDGDGPDLLLALAAGGVICLSLHAGDDLRASLSLASVGRDLVERLP